MDEVSKCEKCKKTEYADKVTLRRCGQCKNVFYCSQDCQKTDWKEHKYHCRKPDAVLRKESEKGFMGFKNAINVPVDVDPSTGDFDPKPIVDRIMADRNQTGKQKVSAPPKPRVWEYKAPETDLEREERMQEFEKVITLSLFNADEKRSWNVLLSSDQKDFMWEVWKLFTEGDKTLPIFRSNTRCFRDLIKMMGSRSQFEWLGKKGSEWVGLAQNEKSRDDEIQTWIESFTKEKLGSEETKEYDATLFTRFVCARRFWSDKE